MTGTQKATRRAAAAVETADGFTAEERVAMRERAREGGSGLRIEPDTGSTWAGRPVRRPAPAFLP